MQIEIVNEMRLAFSKKMRQTQIYYLRKTGNKRRHAFGAVAENPKLAEIASPYLSVLSKSIYSSSCPQLKPAEFELSCPPKLTNFKGTQQCWDYHVLKNMLFSSLAIAT